MTEWTKTLSINSNHILFLDNCSANHEEFIFKPKDLNLWYLFNSPYNFPCMYIENLWLPIKKLWSSEKGKMGDSQINYSALMSILRSEFSRDRDKMGLFF